MLAGKAASKELGRLLVHRVPAGSRSLDVWNAVCMPRDVPDAPLLLLPEQYELLNATLASEIMVELLQVTSPESWQEMHEPSIDMSWSPISQAQQESYAWIDGSFQRKAHF